MYVNTETQEIIGLGALRKLFPKTAFPSTGPDIDWQTANDYAPYIQASAPVITDDEVAEQSGAELVAGIWQTKWTVRAKTLDEKTIEWQRDMNATDREMNRSIEDIISVLPQAQMDSLSSFTMDRYNAKVALRATKPI